MQRAPRPNVRDLWLNASGQPSRDYGMGRRWQATWTGADGKRHYKALGDRDAAAQYADAMHAAAMAARGIRFSLLAVLREVTSQRDRWDPGTLAAELRRRIPEGHEEAALQAALEAVAASAVALHGAPPQSTRRTAAQAAKDARAAALRAEGKTYQQIADLIGWKTGATALMAVQRAHADQAAQNPATNGT